MGKLRQLYLTAPPVLEHVLKEAADKREMSVSSYLRSLLERHHHDEIERIESEIDLGKLVVKNEKVVPTRNGKHK